MELTGRYRTQLMAAFIRGRLAPAETGDLFTKPLAELSEEDHTSLFELGKANELSLHKFKVKSGLPRVEKVLGLMRGLQFSSLMDIGSGRGAFLWPFLEAFPWVQVHCIDILEHRVRDLQAIAAGGYPNLTADLTDLTNSNLADNAFELVNMLEVLEHIPDCNKALAEACRIAEKAILLSVPSKPDDNPEHIHLFTPDRLEQMFTANGFNRVRFHSVTNHIVALALKQA